MYPKYITLLLLTGILFSVLGQENITTNEDETGTIGEGYEEKFSLYGYMIDYIQIGTNLRNSKFSEPSYGNALLLRLKGDWRPGRNLRFHLEFNYQNSTGNQNPYLILGKMKLRSFDQTAYPFEDFNQRMYVDHAWGSVNLGKLDLQFGKFPVAWGTGYVFNPTARVSIPPFLDMVTEDTPGALALLPAYTISDRIAFQAYLAFQDKTQKKFALMGDAQSRNLPYGLKLKTILGSYDLSFCWFREVIYNQIDSRPLDAILEESAHKYLSNVITNTLFANMLANGDTSGAISLFKQMALAQLRQGQPPDRNYIRNYYFGTDFAGALGNFGVYGEFAFRIPKDQTTNNLSLANYKIKNNLEAVVGFDYKISGPDIQTRFEYFYQGTGVKNLKDYNLLTVLSGERLVMSRNYAMLFLEKTSKDIHKYTLAFFSNLNDGSFALLPLYNYTPYDNFEMTFGAFILSGKRGSEFDGRFKIYDVIEIDLIENFCPFLRMKISF